VFLPSFGQTSPKAIDVALEKRNPANVDTMQVTPKLWFVAEVLTMLTNDKRRALHDFVAGTVVVRTNTEDSIAQPDAAPNGGTATQLGNSGVTEGPPSVS
jgi:hypothetical protein